MERGEGRYRWNGGELVPADGPQLGLLVADSFLLNDGRVVAPDRHRERFLRDADIQGIVSPPASFLDAAWQALPRAGRWFPRIDLTERGELELWVRPAPDLTRTVTLWVTDDDPRTTPRTKGPDIPALNHLRELAVTAGATEAIMVDPGGMVRDGATTCLAWWREDELWVQPDTVAKVDSVTVGVLRRMAADRKVPLREGEVSAEELASAETWALNSLHGIRGVSGWIPGHTTPVINDSRLDEWRRDYASRFENL